MTDHESNELVKLRETIRDYHADVKRRLDLCEDQVRNHQEAIYGRAGDINVPGLNIEVERLLGFRERLRLGMGAAWAALLTLATIVWKR
jgi:hypothetical protein